MALTREQVVRTAVGILSDFGLGDLSMRRLARELDVQVGALYWHVKNKQELLVDVAAQLLRDIGAEPTPVGAPRDAIKRLAGAIRAALVPVPDSAEVVQLAQTMQPAALAPLTLLRDLLEESGVPADRAAWAQHLLLNHILGSVAAHQNRTTLDALEAVGGPDLGEAAFAWGVGAILDGVLGRPMEPLPHTA